MTDPSLPSVRMALNMPWKAINEIERRLLWPLARLRFSLAGVK